MARAGFLPRQRRWPFFVAGALVLLFILFTISSGFVVNLLWFREVHLSQVFWSVLKTKLLLGFVFGLLFFAGLFVNLWIVRRITPDTRVLTPDQEVIENIRQIADPYLRWLIPIGCAFLAIIVGLAASKQWQTFLLWRNSSGVTFGAPEPLFHKDPAFYIFTLPWWKFVQGWLFSTLVGITFLTIIGHVLWGGIRPQAPRFADKVAPQVRAHLSVLLGLIMVAKAVGYWLGRFNLLGSPRGIVHGASYTDVHAQLPALYLLAIAALISAILFFLNARVKLWSLPVISVVLLVVVSVVVGTAIPAFVQQFSVKPQEFQREQPYIQDNITGTRAAFGLNTIKQETQPIQPLVTAKDLADNSATVSNIRLWRPTVLEQDFQSLQRIRQYYEFNDVDVDRYTIDGQPRVLMISARELSAPGIPQTGGAWQNQHLAYTHGIGVVSAQVNTSAPDGSPAFTLKDIPVIGQPTITQPRIYYGEFRSSSGTQQSVPFVVTHTGTPEVDFPGATPADETTFAYDGLGGIPIGNIFQRAMFAWNYKDVNLLISGQIHSDSKILINRDLQTRVQTAAPFLTFDKDPYLTVIGGRLQWIWDAYTTTNQYPYSESVDLGDATGGQIAGGSVNYIRNSVKVVVDAYDGTMHYYVSDPNDPIIKVWSAAFPDMFTPESDASPELQAHFRYPENLFQIQATQFARYHVTDPTTFFRGTDAWQIPSDPTFCADPANAARSECSKTDPSGEAPKISPYYQLLKLPGATSEQFQLITPFTPAGRPNMVAYMAANSDPSGYGDLTAFQFPSDQTIDGPSTVFAQINADPTFSQERSLLSQGGSSVLFGDFLVIPLGQSVLYVEPVYVSSTQTNSVPLLKRIIVVNGNTVAVGTTLQDALDQAVAGAAPGGPSGPGNPTGTPQARIANLLAQAVQHFQAAQDALNAGDLGTYQTELKAAQDLVQQANDLAQKIDTSRGTSTSTSTPTPSPTITIAPSPTASP
ncbi:MAG: uncharacterized protein QOI81_1225 [Actinomycetota bacterium]|nr:uncharacterized protein [Actinomycetota bacterium]